MAELDLTFSGGGVRLAGTLALPAAADGPVPAALVLPGSGPIDRDADMKRLRLGISRELAGALAAAGIASLRYDKRGVGASGGDFLHTGLSDNLADGRAALAALAARPEVDPARLLVVGHSEGALLAMALVAGLTAGPVEATPAGVVLLSPAAVPGKEMLAWQTRQVAATLPWPVKALLRLLRIDLVRKQRANVARLEASTADVLRMGGRRINARWHRELLAFDPAPALARLTLPVLAVTGSKDLQVDPGDLQTLAQLVPGPVETHVIADLTHLLRRDAQVASLSHYRKLLRRPVDAELLRLVTAWAERVTAAPRP